MNSYYVYLLTNERQPVIYVGITNNLKRCIAEHEEGKGSTFTAKYFLDRLVYVEEYKDPMEAIHREKFLEGKSKQYKKSLIDTFNLGWKDLSFELI